MSDLDEIALKISELKCCVIIPTFNNDKTLKKVIDDVLNYTQQLIVVNDGSTDSTSQILKELGTKVQIINFESNRGKGMALRKGFEKAYNMGFKYAITIDSDGQHYADDIPVFIEELENYKNILLIGSRNMMHESVPKNSSFGNKFSNFWFWVETGKKLNDTQSGFRLYPLDEINKIKFYTSKFEFEIESIVKASWRGIEVKNVPIKVLYSDNRISHFRPIKDFARISVLNTWLVLVAFLYVKPRDLFIKIKRKGIKRFFVENVLQSSDSPIKKALSISLGIFIGISPFWGFQTLLVLGLAVVFKLNKAIAFAFSNVSFPPMIPFIVFASYKIGNWILGTEEISVDFENITTNVKLLTHIKEYIIGSFILASVSSIFFGLMGYVFFKLRVKKH